MSISFINATAMAITALDSRHKEIYHIITTSKYIMGFIWDILGSALNGLVFAFVKLLGRRPSHVLEQQLMVSMFAFVFTLYLHWGYCELRFSRDEI